MNNDIYSLEEIKSIIAPVFKRYNISKAYLFGSYARGEATEKSDIDLMIVPQNYNGIGFTVCRLYEALGYAFNKPVDVITEKDAEQVMPATIERDKVIVYEQQNKN